MKPRTPEITPQGDLFRSRLENLIAPRHPLVLLARQIDWEGLNTEFGAFFEGAVVGQPPKATRLMVGLLYLKHAYSLSDEALLERWVENPYWQAFCGMEYFQHEPPIHPSSLSRYRTRLGPAGCEELLRRTIVAGLAEGVIEKRDLTEVLVDATVMEKAITYPTGSKLYLRSLLRLNRVARQSGIDLRQIYTRTAKRMAAQIGRYAHAKQFRRMHRELKKLKGRLGRVVRDLERKTASWDVVPEALTRDLALAQRLLNQQRTGADKLYSLHAPEVECINKVRGEVAHIIVSPAQKVGDETGRSVGRSLPVYALLVTAACEATGTTYRAFGPRRLPRGNGVTCQRRGGWDARLSGMVNRSELLQASLCMTSQRC